MKKRTEKAAGYVFRVFGLIAVVSVIAITVYMIIKGTPALVKVGVPKLLFNDVIDALTVDILESTSAPVIPNSSILLKLFITSVILAALFKLIAVKLNLAILTSY